MILLKMPDDINHWHQKSPFHVTMLFEPIYRNLAVEIIRVTHFWPCSHDVIPWQKGGGLHYKMSCHCQWSGVREKWRVCYPVLPRLPVSSSLTAMKAGHSDWPKCHYHWRWSTKQPTERKERSVSSSLPENKKDNARYYSSLRPEILLYFPLPNIRPIVETIP